MFWQQASGILRRVPVLFAGVFVGALAFLAWLQQSPTMLDPDGFYHGVVALEYWQHGIMRSFPWLPLTFLADHFADQHLLYHWLLAPLTGLAGTFWGTKIGIAVFGALAVAVFWYTLHELKVRPAWWHVALLVGTPAFLLRLSLAKALPLSLVCFCAGIVLLTKRHSKGLLALTAIYVWTYGAWPLFVVLVALYDAVHWWQTRARPLAPWVLLGAAVGLLIHPHTPHTLWFFWRQTIEIALQPIPANVVGTEWLPYQADRYLPVMRPFLLAVAATIVLVVTRWPLVRDRAKEPLRIALSITACLLLIASWMASRYVEYAVPLGTIALALWLTPLYETLSQRIQRTLQVTVLVVILLAAPSYARIAQRTLAGGHPATEFTAVSQWAREHIPAHTILFNIRWDHFPILLAHDASRPYGSGLDPRFFSPEQFAAWEGIYLRTDPDPAQTLRKVFNIRYVLVTGADTVRVMQAYLVGHGLRPVYNDSEASIYVLP